MSNTTYSGRGIFLPREMLKSEAFLSLSTGAAHIVLMTFMAKRQVEKRKVPAGGEYWEVVNDGALVYTYSEARRQGLTPTRFCDALDLLLERGFIRVAKAGRGKHRAKTFFALSDAWRTWKPGDPPKAQRRKRARPAGSPGFKPGNQAWREKIPQARKS